MLHIETFAAFRFHVQEEPMTLDPLHSHSTISSYVLSTLYTPLMQYQDGRLKPLGARRCDWLSGTTLRCQLRTDWLWSDGQPVTADEIVFAVREMFEQKSTRVDSFLGLKNSAEILRHEKPIEQLGVLAISRSAVEFELTKPDIEFQYRLIDPVVSPRRKDILADGHVSAGPFIFEKRVPGRSLLFHNNPKYFVKKPRPDVEVMVVEADDTALKMFDKGELNFHRRLPVEAAPAYQNKPGFIKQPLLRFDYIGVGPELEYQPELRRRLALSLAPQYRAMMKIFASLGPPGCIGLPKALLPHSMCFEKTAVSPYDSKELALLPRLSLTIATQGGDTVVRQAELFQSGWRKNLGLDVEIKLKEVKQLEGDLRKSPPALFRRGVNLERPTCLAALELFQSKSLNNFVHFENKIYDSILDKMRTTRERSAMAALCQKGSELLLKSYRIIPLGEIQFFMLSDQKFDGFRINELNQLDLSHLAERRH